MTEKPGKDFEHIVAAIHKRYANNAQVTENEHVNGRQIDVVIRTTVATYPLTIIVECKDYARTVDIGKVDELIGKLDEVGAQAAILVSNSGFSEKAKERALKDKRIQLASVVDITNPNLRARPQVPITCEFRGISTYKLRVSGHGTNKFIFSQKDMLSARRRFTELWNNGRVPTDLGQQEFIELGVSAEEGLVEVAYLYKVSRRIFYGNSEFDNGNGIFNHTTQKFTSNEMAFSLDTSEVEASWKQIPEEQLETVQKFGHLIAFDTYPLPTEEESLF